MNKELEALEVIAEGLCCSIYERDNHMYDEEINTVKSALERKEKLEKVWEIIKNNVVIEEASMFLDGTNNIIYIPCNDIYIEKEKYNLLKEILEEK